MCRSDHADTLLTVDLDAITINFKLLKGRLHGARCAAVVKANAYGLGAVPVVKALLGAGCDEFFVATLDEGIALREHFPEPQIGIFNGIMAGAETACAHHRLIPAVNSLDQLARWRASSGGESPRQAVLHLDTGMCRLGLTPDEVDLLAREPEQLKGVEPYLLMSHLACAEDADQPLNVVQRDTFIAALARLPPAPESLANSSGIFLGSDFHFDLVRPGAALYGINPTPGRPNPMAEVVRLQAKIIQVRDVDSPQTVGYGATHRVAGPGRIATIPVGYADGYRRSLGGCGSVAINGDIVPVVGRISMDLITLDVSSLPAEAARPGAIVDLIGGPRPVDSVAADAGTIAYEILTNLGHRYKRRYLGGGS